MFKLVLNIHILPEKGDPTLYKNGINLDIKMILS